MESAAGPRRISGIGRAQLSDDRISGELHVIRSFPPKVLKAQAPVIFDVGANEGDYSAAISRGSRRRGSTPLSRILPPSRGRPKNYHMGSNSRTSRWAPRTGRSPLYDRCDTKGSAHASLHRDVWKNCSTARLFRRRWKSSLSILLSQRIRPSELIS